MHKHNNIKKQNARKKLIEELYAERWKTPNIEFGEIIRRMYVEMNMTQISMASTLHCSTGTINNWLKEYGIPAKKMRWM